RELVALELVWRRGGGERPTPDEYHARFPEFAGLIDAVFGEAAPPDSGEPPAAPSSDPGGKTERTGEEAVIAAPGHPETLAPRGAGSLGADVKATMSPTPEQARPATAVRPAIPGYELLGELGRGGMGVVYQARHVKLNRLVALKMVRDGCVAAPDQLARF